MGSFSLSLNDLAKFKELKKVRASLLSSLTGIFRLFPRFRGIKRSQDLNGKL